MNINIKYLTRHNYLIANRIKHRRQFAPAVFRNDRRSGIKEVIYITRKSRITASVTSHYPDRGDIQSVLELNCLDPVIAVMRIPLCPVIALPVYFHPYRVTVGIEINIIYLDKQTLCVRQINKSRRVVTYTSASCMEVESYPVVHILLHHQPFYLIVRGQVGFELGLDLEINIVRILDYSSGSVTAGPWVMVNALWYLNSEPCVTRSGTIKIIRAITDRIDECPNVGIENLSIKVIGDYSGFVRPSCSEHQIRALQYYTVAINRCYHISI